LNEVKMINQAPLTLPEVLPYKILLTDWNRKLNEVKMINQAPLTLPEVLIYKTSLIV